MPIVTYTTLWFLRRAAFLGTCCDQPHHDSHHDHNEDHQQRTTTQALVRCTHIKGEWRCFASSLRDKVQNGITGNNRRNDTPDALRWVRWFRGDFLTHKVA